jgi:CBS domain containing-hemolysin-like protein
VGDIYDEADGDAGPQEEGRQIIPTEDGAYAIDGMADLEETCETLGMEVSEEELREFGTLSGFLCHQAGEIPEAGDVVLVSRYRFTVLDCDERKIKQVRAEQTTEAETPYEREGDEL